MVKLTRVDSVGHFDAKKTSRHAIYSIDFQPFGGRLATAGGDCTVKLWNTEYILSDRSQSMSDALLTTLSTHSKSVNVVRWSSDGRFLASGSDDCYVIVYRYTPDAMSNQPFGSNSVKNKENWSRCFTLQGHVMDVLDICWSSQGILASASIDNNIMIWDFRAEMANMAQGNSYTTALISPFRVLSGHLSFVKGVSFDPVGRYLASSGGDNLVILWDCGSWIPLHRLEGPLKDSPDRSIFRRVSWAPDGNSLCITGGTKSSKAVGMVLLRGSWVCAADLVGHEAPSVCCRFCPYVLAPYIPGASKNSTNDNQIITKGKTRDPAPHCCVVLGDQIGVVSLWSSDKKIPMLDLKEVFSGSATDIAWTLRDSISSGPPCLAFAVGSLDGTVLFVQLGTDVGVPLSPQALDRHFTALYGQGQTCLQENVTAIVSHPAALKYMNATQRKKILKSSDDAGTEERQRTTTPSTISSSTVPSSSSSSAALPIPINSNNKNNNNNNNINNNCQPSVVEQQVVSRRKDGKKRIQPILVAQTGGSGGDSVSGNSAAPPLSSYMVCDDDRVTSGSSSSKSGSSSSSSSSSSIHTHQGSVNGDGDNTRDKNRNDISDSNNDDSNSNEERNEGSRIEKLTSSLNPQISPIIDQNTQNNVNIPIIHNSEEPCKNHLNEVNESNEKEINASKGDNNVNSYDNNDDNVNDNCNYDMNNDHDNNTYDDGYDNGVQCEQNDNNEGDKTCNNNSNNTNPTETAKQTERDVDVEVGKGVKRRRSSVTFSDTASVLHDKQININANSDIGSNGMSGISGQSTTSPLLVPLSTSTSTAAVAVGEGGRRGNGDGSADRIVIRVKKKSGISNGVGHFPSTLSASTVPGISGIPVIPAANAAATTATAARDGEVVGWGGGWGVSSGYTGMEGLSSSSAPTDSLLPTVPTTSSSSSIPSSSSSSSVAVGVSTVQGSVTNTVSSVRTVGKGELASEKLKDKSKLFPSIKTSQTLNGKNSDNMNLNKNKVSDIDNRSSSSNISQKSKNKNNNNIENNINGSSSGNSGSNLNKTLPKNAMKKPFDQSQSSFSSSASSSSSLPFPSSSSSSSSSSLLTITFFHNEIKCSTPHPHTSTLSSLVRIEEKKERKGKGILHFLRNVPQRMFLKSDRLLPPAHLTKNRNIILSIFSRISLIQANSHHRDEISGGYNNDGNSITNGNMNVNVNEGEGGHRSESESDSNGCVWQAVVTGVVSCVSGAQRTHTDTGMHSSSFSSYTSSLSSIQSSHTASRDGLCVVGCTDGTLHLLSLDSGLRLAPPMVLGMGVVAVDVCPLSDCLRVLAVTVEGELWVWESGNYNCRNSDGRNGDFRCVVKSSIKSPLASMRHRIDFHGSNYDMYDNDNNDDSNDSSNNKSRPNSRRIDTVHKDNDGGENEGRDKEVVEGTNKDRIKNRSSSSSSSSPSSSSSSMDYAGVSLEECSLSSSGKLSISLLCQDSQGRGNVGGAWQSFSYDESCHVWIRTADVRHALSSLFTPSFYENDTNNEKMSNNGNENNVRIENTDNRWIEKLKNGATSTSFSTSLDSQQAVAARWSGVTLSEVLDIARLGLNQDNNGQNYMQNQSNQSNQTRPPHLRESQMSDWSAMVTSSYVEEKILLSFALGTMQETGEWVAQWCRSNCLAGLHQRVQWVANELLKTAKNSLQVLSEQTTKNPEYANSIGVAAAGCMGVHGSGGGGVGVECYDMTVEDATNGDSMRDPSHSSSYSFTSFSSTTSSSSPPSSSSHIPRLTTHLSQSSSSTRTSDFSHTHTHSLPPSNGWNWCHTCDQKFLFEQLRNLKKNDTAGQRNSLGRNRPLTASLPRPPSLILLEEVIMPAVGQCCVDNGSASLKSKSITSRSLTLLASIDESISFLSETYSYHTA